MAAILLPQSSQCIEQLAKLCFEVFQQWQLLDHKELYLEPQFQQLFLIDGNGAFFTISPWQDLVIYIQLKRPILCFRFQVTHLNHCEEVKNWLTFKKNGTLVNRSDATIKTCWNEILSKGVLDIFFFWNPSQAVFHQVPGPKRYQGPDGNPWFVTPSPPHGNDTKIPIAANGGGVPARFFINSKGILYAYGILFVEKSTSINRSQTFLLGTLSRSLQFWVKTPWGWPFNWLFFSGSLAVLGSPKGQDWSLEISGPGTF